LNLAARIESVVQEALDQQRLVGSVVLVARDGDVIYRQAANTGDL